jgi:hypothetical protein
MATPKRTNRSAYGEYGLTELDGYEVPFLSASTASSLVPTPGTYVSDFAHGRGGLTSALGWSSNSTSGKLARGAAAFGVEAIPKRYSSEEFGGMRLSGNPAEPLSYDFVNLDQAAKRFNIDKSEFKPYEVPVAGNTIDSETGSQTSGIVQYLYDSEGSSAGSKPLTRTVSVDEQVFNKLNELTKDYYSYTADTLVPGKATEGGEKSFQTVLYKQEGDVLKPIAKPIEHGGMQNYDVYAGSTGGFSLSELIQGIAPVAALAIGGPLLDAALVGGAAAGAGGSIGGINLGGAFVPTAGSGASFTLPAAAAAGAGGSIGGINLGGAFTPTAGSGASFAVPGTAGAGSSLLGPTYAELGLTGVEGGLAGPTYGELGLTGLELGTEASTGAPIFDYSQEVILSPNGNYIPANTLPSEIAGLDESIRIAGEAAIKAAPSISPSQAVNALRGASGLLGGPQQPTQQGAAPTPQNITPRGQVDYSGILSLLQIPSPRRNMYSLLG